MQSTVSVWLRQNLGRCKIGVRVNFKVQAQIQFFAKKIFELMQLHPFRFAALVWFT